MLNLCKQNIDLTKYKLILTKNAVFFSGIIPMTF
jgi:hypothetical protein